MSHLIRDNRLADDDWTLIPADAPIDAPLPDAPVIAPAKWWPARRDELLAHPHALGLWIDSSEHPELIADALAQLKLVAINFPVFSDGRGYSYARLLREKYGFAGELRAIGDVLRDQLFLMRRCGFDSFSVRADRDAAQAVSGLADFSHVYQSATVDPCPPLLLREAGAQA